MSSTSTGPTDTARVFLALWPRPAVRRDLLACRDGWTWNATAALVRPEQLHLTLHFLGDVQRSRLPGLIHGLTVPFQPLELRLGHSEVWPNGVAVLQPGTVPDRLLRLHAALQVALRSRALPVEARAFHPHVTFARGARGAKPPTQRPPVRWRVGGYALVESRPGPPREYLMLQWYA